MVSIDSCLTPPSALAEIDVDLGCGFVQDAKDLTILPALVERAKYSPVLVKTLQGVYLDICFCP